MLEVKIESNDKCISCCSPDKNTRKISINRDCGVYKGANIVTFYLCNDCLRKLAKEFVPFS